MADTTPALGHGLPAMQEVVRQIRRTLHTRERQLAKSTAALLGKPPASARESAARAALTPEEQRSAALEDSRADLATQIVHTDQGARPRLPIER